MSSELIAPARATSRCRSSATAPARSSHLCERECSIQRQHQKLDRDRAEPDLPAADARAARRGGGARWPRPCATAVSARSSSWSTPTPSDAFRLHRGQSAPAGRAHRDRGGDRPRSGARAACGSPPARRWPTLGLRRRRPEAARLCDAAARQHGDHGPDGAAQPTGGVLARCSSRRRGRASASTASAMPATAPAPRFDSLLAKVIVHAPGRSLHDVAARRPRAPCASSGIEGVATNIAFLAAPCCAHDAMSGRNRDRDTTCVDRSTSQRAGRRPREWCGRAAPCFAATVRTGGPGALEAHVARAAPDGHGRGRRADAGHDRQRSRSRRRVVRAGQPLAVHGSDEDGASRQRRRRRRVRRVMVGAGDDVR